MSKIIDGILLLIPTLLAITFILLAVYLFWFETTQTSEEIQVGTVIDTKFEKHCTRGCHRHFLTIMNINDSNENATIDDEDLYEIAKIGHQYTIHSKVYYEDGNKKIFGSWYNENQN
jgi:hypothetical protein